MDPSPPLTSSWSSWDWTKVGSHPHIISLMYPSCFASFPSCRAGDRPKKARVDYGWLNRDYDGYEGITTTLPNAKETVNLEDVICRVDAIFTSSLLQPKHFAVHRQNITEIVQVLFVAQP